MYEEIFCVKNQNELISAQVKDAKRSSPLASLAPTAHRARWS